MIIRKRERLKKRAQRLALLQALDRAETSADYEAVELGLTYLSTGEKYVKESAEEAETTQAEKLRKISPEEIWKMHIRLGSWRKVCEELVVSESALSRYRRENQDFFEERKEEQCTWLQLDKEDYIVDLIYNMRIKQQASLRCIGERVGVSPYNIKKIIECGANYARLANKKKCSKYITL